MKGSLLPKLFVVSLVYSKTVPYAQRRVFITSSSSLKTTLNLTSIFDIVSFCFDVHLH